MFQTFYDSLNDRFIAAPLRSGSSYTSSFAKELGWKEGGEVLYELVEEGELDYNCFHLLNTCQPLTLIYLMQSDKYKDSKWVTVIRDPMSRYLSAVCMILTGYYDAPSYVPPHEVKLAENYRSSGYINLGDNTAYNHVDRLIERRNAKSWFFDFAFSDSHCLPCASVQLLMCAMKESIETVDLQNWEAWLKQNYPAGTSVPANFYERMRHTHRRDNSNVPKDSYVSVFDRFLKPLLWYNDVEAHQVGVKSTFSKFISFELDAWDALNSPVAVKDTVFYQSKLNSLLEDPYFITRDPLYYSMYTNINKIVKEDSPYYHKLASISARKEELQKFVIDNSWLNNINT